MMGEDVMTGKMLEHTELMHIENPTTPIMDRTSVNRPLETGLAGIDLIYPIGRGPVSYTHLDVYKRQDMDSIVTDKRKFSAEDNQSDQ